MGVVGDGEIRVAAVLRRERHLLDRVLAVRRPGRVRVQVTAQVGELHQLWQCAVSSRLQLAEVLAQLRFDVGVAEVRVELLLAAGLEDLAGLDVLDAVLGDREAAPHPPGAKILRGRKIPPCPPPPPRPPTPRGGGGSPPTPNPPPAPAGRPA